jgi:hypothetical protein
MLLSTSPHTDTAAFGRVGAYFIRSQSRISATNLLYRIEGFTVER